MLSGIVGTIGTAAFAGPPIGAPALPEAEYMFAPGLIYLNTASLGPTPRSVLDATLKAWYELESNPVAMSYGEGAVLKATDIARERLASFIGCSADELLITRSTTDAMNTAALAIGLDRGDRVLTTDTEHHGGSICWTYLKKRVGIEIDVVPVGAAETDADAIVRRFEKAITKQTRVISFSHVISATGLLMPVAEITALAKSRGILTIVDGAQAIGCIDVNVRSLGCDAYAAPGHKWLLGPKGTGFLYISKEAAAKIQPVEREDGVRFVVESTGIGALPLAVGLGTAVEEMRARSMAKVAKRNMELRDRAYAALIRMPGIKMMSPPPGATATPLVAFKLPDAVDSISMRRDILRPKYKIVVKSAEKRFFNGLRLSPHLFNTEADIDATINAIRAELGGNSLSVPAKFQPPA